MTDFPIPEGGLTAAESEELLLMSGHATGPEPLSPAAQAVLDAASNHWPGGSNHPSKRACVAAALRAAVDQAIPLTKTPWGTMLIPVLTAQESRDRLLAIAAELEGAG